MTKVTDYVYVAEFVSLFPIRTGNLIRNKFYKWTLAGYGKNVTINFGTIISYKETTIGNNVWLGVNNIFGSVDIKRQYDHSPVMPICKCKTTNRTRCLV